MSLFKSTQDPGGNPSRNGSTQKHPRGSPTLLLPMLAWHSTQGNLGLHSLYISLEIIRYLHTIWHENFTWN